MFFILTFRFSDTKEATSSWKDNKNKYAQNLNIYISGELGQLFTIEAAHYSLNFIQMMCYSVFANANKMLKFLFQIVLRQNDPEVLAKNKYKIGTNLQINANFWKIIIFRKKWLRWNICSNIIRLNRLNIHFFLSTYSFIKSNFDVPIKSNSGVEFCTRLTLM